MMLVEKKNESGGDSPLLTPTTYGPEEDLIVLRTVSARLQSDNHLSSVPRSNRKIGGGCSPNISRPIHHDLDRGGGGGGCSSHILAWHDLEPLHVAAISLPLWTEICGRLSSDDWLQQCAALSTVRRIALYNPSVLKNGPPINPQKPSTARGGSMSQILMLKILTLAESLRSVVARAALVTVHDLFLFAYDHLESGSAGEAFITCVKKVAGGGGFIAEEAYKCWRQIILLLEPLRLISAVDIVMTKNARNNAAIRAHCLLSLCFLGLRSTPSELKFITNQKGFPQQLLKPIFRATTDASSECRTAASLCLAVYLSLMPDLWTRYRQHLTDVDATTIILKCQRLQLPDLKDSFALTSLLQLYRELPDEAPMDGSLERLQIVLANIEEIASSSNCEAQSYHQPRNDFMKSNWRLQMETVAFVPSRSGGHTVAHVSTRSTNCSSNMFEGRVLRSQIRGANGRVPEVSTVSHVTRNTSEKGLRTRW